MPNELPGALESKCRSCLAPVEVLASELTSGIAIGHRKVVEMVQIRRVFVPGGGSLFIGDRDKLPLFISRGDMSYSMKDQRAKEWVYYTRVMPYFCGDTGGELRIKDGNFCGETWRSKKPEYVRCLLEDCYDVYDCVRAEGTYAGVEVMVLAGHMMCAEMPRVAGVDYDYYEVDYLIKRLREAGGLSSLGSISKT